MAGRFFSGAAEKTFGTRLVGLISEQYTSSIRGYTKEESGRAMVLIKHGIEYTKVEAIGDTIVIRVGSHYIGATYWSPNENIGGPLMDLENVMKGKEQAQWIIGGDLNIGISPWVNPVTLGWRKKRRSEIAQITLESLDLVICNNRTPTSIHGGRDTVNDYTLKKNAEVNNWRVLEEGLISGHRFIQFQLNRVDVKHKETVVLKTDLKKFEARIKAEMPLLNEEESREAVIKNATVFTNWLTDIIQSCTTETPIKKSSNWWSDSIESLKTKYYKAKIRAIRCKHPELKQLLNEEAKEIKKEYYKAIYVAKEEAWRDFITQHQA